MQTLRLAPSLLAALAAAQPTVAPSPETVGRARGEDVGAYNVVNQFETGYRFHSVDGDLNRYRSDINFGNGIRLLGSNLTVHSKEGHGRLFDELTLTTLGLGNDPYQFASLRLQHNKFYRYDLTWRINQYLNPGLTTGTLGGHFLDTRRQMHDHDLVLLPQAPIKFIAGYSRNSQDGPGLATIQLFDSRGDEFPFAASVDRRQSEARAGVEIQAGGFKFFLLRGWQYYSESTTHRLDGPHPGANLADRTALESLRRSEPYIGNTPYWRFNLFNERKSWFAVNARFSYAGGRRSFAFDDLATGADRFGGARTRQVLVSGTGRRPVSSGALTLSLFPSNRFTLANHTAYHQVLIDGDGSYREINDSTTGPAFLRFQHLGIRTIVNSSDASFKAATWLGLYGGYHFSTRRIRSQEGERSGAFSDLVSSTQDNRLHSATAGVRYLPSRAVSLNLETEIGRADRPFFPSSERRYHALGGRLQYKSKTLALSGAARTNFNTNSSSLFVHSSRARNYSFDASWNPSNRFSLDAGYSKLHLDTLTGIAYFAAFDLIEGEHSLYRSNLHAAHAGVRLALRGRADLFFAFHRVQDTGDGRSAAAQPPSGAPAGSALAAFRAVQTFPMAYDSPQARFSLRLHSRIRWNLGYQFYRYDEDFSPARFYRAHTGFTSVLWSF